MGSLVVNAEGDYISRTATLPSLGAATMAGWVNLDTVTPGEQKAIAGLIAGSAERLVLFFHSDNTLCLLSNAYSVAPFDAAPTGRAGTWLYFAITSNSTNLKGYWWYNNSGSLVLGGSATYDGWSSPGSTTSMTVGARPNWLDQSTLGKYAYWKTWNRVLSQAEIEAEAYSTTYVLTTDKNTGFADSATDISGNGRDWTHNSITTDASTPPVNTFSFDESIYPNAVSLTNLSGAYTDIDESPDSPDGSWLVVA